MNETFKSLTLVLLLLITSCGNSEKKEQKTSEESEAKTLVSKDQNQEKTILFFGNSLTAGYGLEEGQAFPELIQKKIDSLGLNYEVINAGLSGETTAAGKNRLDWVLKQGVDIFVLELGANDGLRGIPLEETRKNLQDIIDKVRKKNPEVKIILAGMQIPPNMGQDYTEKFRKIFPELAEKNNVYLIPFLLKGVAGNSELNQQDGIHPTAEGDKIVAKNVWEVLKPLLKESAGPEA
ncbi:arylesterase [Christiangramia fulva]|uniref:Arylesterase n=1 Tax=Christiangramia fulva TaxID=2126553 RepID=A0A2R3Z9C9_9FLAO|nr:arylesterase [Christiangramia fulva]AVR46850.1 arylesterase [Christiangramia fulva]